MLRGCNRIWSLRGHHILGADIARRLDLVDLLKLGQYLSGGGLADDLLQQRRVVKDEVPDRRQPRWSAVEHESVHPRHLAHLSGVLLAPMLKSLQCDADPLGIP